MSKILASLLKIIKTFENINDEKINNYIIFNLYKLYTYSYKDSYKDRNKFYYFLNKIIKNINIYINKKRYIYPSIYLQCIYRNLMTIKICINNDNYLQNFINDYKKINVLNNMLIYQ